MIKNRQIKGKGEGRKGRKKGRKKLTYRFLAISFLQERREGKRGQKGGIGAIRGKWGLRESQQ